MAIARPFLATSLLLCSLLVIASAIDYGAYDSSKTQPVSMPEETVNPGFSATPVNQPQHETEKPGYRTEPVNRPEPEKEEKPGRGTENKLYQQQPVENQKAEFENGAYAKPDLYPTTTPEVLPIGVEGLVLCKSGPKYYPIQGALARITCLAVDENGYEKTHSVRSGETDAKGYFFARLSPLGLDNAGDNKLSKLRDCRAFLESSPLETCNVPVDVNKGISGAPLSDFRVLDRMGMKLFSVGPFFFTSPPNSVPNGY
ncbi:hypothetical protein GQ457_05G001970 [Hibiscus cannabinus]